MKENTLLEDVEKSEKDTPYLCETEDNCSENQTPYCVRIHTFLTLVFLGVFTNGITKGFLIFPSSLTIATYA